MYYVHSLNVLFIKSTFLPVPNQSKINILFIDIIAQYAIIVKMSLANNSIK